MLFGTQVMRSCFVLEIRVAPPFRAGLKIVKLMCRASALEYKISSHALCKNIDSRGLGHEG